MIHDPIYLSRFTQNPDFDNLNCNSILHNFNLTNIYKFDTFYFILYYTSFDVSTLIILFEYYYFFILFYILEEALVACRKRKSETLTLVTNKIIIWDFIKKQKIIILEYMRGCGCHTSQTAFLVYYQYKIGIWWS